MRASLLAAARALFVAKGYAETGTPEIAVAAGATRGALYHHFEDKRALFRAVVEAEAAIVDAAIGSASQGASPRDALVQGGAGYLSAMSQPGRVRLLLLDGPAVLGRAEMDAIDARHAMGSLREGIAAAVTQGGLPRDLPIDAATALLSAAFDRAAMSIGGGADAASYRAALTMLIDGLFALARPRDTG